MVGKILCVYILVEKILRNTDTVYRYCVIQRMCNVYTVESGQLVRLNCSYNQGSKMISLKNVQTHHFGKTEPQCWKWECLCRYCPHCRGVVGAVLHFKYRLTDLHVLTAAYIPWTMIKFTIVRKWEHIQIDSYNLKEVNSHIFNE